MRLLLAALAASTIALSACAQEPAGSSFTPAQREEFGELVRAYLLENPELIEEVFVALDAKRERETLERSTAQIALNQDALYNNPLDYSVGPKDAKVTVVEFFDYNCSFCKRSAGWMQELVDTHGDDVRIIFKEAPIFGEKGNGSQVAAIAALAAIEQGKYAELHFALMETPGQVTPQIVESTATSLGLDWAAIEARLEDPALTSHAEDTLTLGRLIGMSGTPTFIVNGVLVGGARFDELDRLVAEGLAREG